MFRFLLEKYEKYKNWRLYKRNAKILEDIKKAKQCYIDDIGLQFMCFCFRRVNYEKYRDENAIRKIIPEFNRVDLGAKTDERHLVWWWTSDRESRIKAFDKLIEIYTLKTEKKYGKDY